MLIHLKNITDEGKDFELNCENNEFVEIQKANKLSNDSKVCFRIQQAGEVYILSSQLELKMATTCSFCAWDYDRVINKTSKEYLIPNMENTTQERRQLHVQDLEKEIWQDEKPPGLNGDDFNAITYFNELIGFLNPFQSPCEKEDHQSCDRFTEAMSYSEDLDLEKEKRENNPFSALKKLQIDKKH